MRTISLFLALTLGAAEVQAQYPASANSLRWEGTTSNAGPFCWGFSCRPERADVRTGESGTLRIRVDGPLPYAIAASLSATSCLPIRPFYNNLVLDAPITILQAGVCSGPSPILACPSCEETFTLTVPRGLPAGTRFSLQGITGVFPVPGSPIGSWTQTITFNVR
ncbi:MAG: hypothetical protein AAF628_05300 [Planctomycetota bacterium]